MPDAAAAPRLSYDLVAPAGRVAAGVAVMVTAPGVEGEFGARAGHAPFAAILRPGLLIIEAADPGQSRRLFVSGGFAGVEPEKITILVDEAIALEELDAAELEAQITRAREDSTQARLPETRSLAQAEVQRLEAMRAALSRAAG